MDNNCHIPDLVQAFSYVENDLHLNFPFGWNINYTSFIQISVFLSTGRINKNQDVGKLFPAASVQYEQCISLIRSF